MNNKQSVLMMCDFAIQWKSNSLKTISSKKPYGNQSTVSFC